MKKSIKYITLIAGLCLCTYPLVASCIERYEQKNAISTYREDISVQEDTFTACIQNASEYNDMLHQSKGYIVADLQEGVLSKESYLKQLNLSGNGMMGTIDIPKISVNLPIYHGTEEEVLSIGVGHLEGTSLPVGGVNTHSVLTGHRGLPNSKLFTRLDELEDGDLFYIQVCNKTLAYTVSNIQVIKPEEVECLEIQQDKDLVSLVTCTPYGINSHRLVVTGERTSYEETEYLSIEPQMASMREIIFAALPLILVGIVAVKFIKERKGRNHAK